MHRARARCPNRKLCHTVYWELDANQRDSGRYNVNTRRHKAGRFFFSFASTRRVWTFMTLRLSIIPFVLAPQRQAMAFRDRKHKASQWDYERILLIPRIGTYMRAMRTAREQKDGTIFAFLESGCQQPHALSRVTLSRGRARARELGPHAYRLAADDDIFDQAEAAAAATFSPLPGSFELRHIHDSKSLTHSPAALSDKI